MVLERLRTNTESSANGDIAASIEQLRHMVRELAARVALQQVRASDGPQPRQTGKTPPQAVQRVVIKQAAPQSRVPRAFWERRYLHRLSWRSLR
jgi:hypothetical protein